LKKIYDISVRLGEESILYPGDTPYSRELVQNIKDGGICDLSKLVMSAHSGTHIDAPAHFIQGGKSLDQYEVRDFILPAQVVEIRDKLSVRPAELENLAIGAGEALLFRTNNSTSGQSKNGTFSEQFVYLSPEAADICIEKRVKLVGFDYITVERYGDQEFPTHRRLLEKDIPILEGIHLKDVPAGRYKLICLPLKISGGEASPVRAILVQ
jgi:arylformamidase